MSDSDDWENAADDIIEDKKEENKEENKFADDDDVDSDEERAEKKKKAAEEAKAKAAAAPKKAKKPDYEAMFEARQGKGAAKAQAMAKQGLKGEEVSRAAEEDITDQLFQQDLNMEATGLRS